MQKPGKSHATTLPRENTVIIPAEDFAEVRLSRWQHQQSIITFLLQPFALVVDFFFGVP